MNEEELSFDEQVKEYQKNKELWGNQRIFNYLKDNLKIRHRLYTDGSSECSLLLKNPNTNEFETISLSED